MRTLLLSLASAAVLAASPTAFAAGGKAADGKADAKQGARGVELSALVLPVARDNRLVSYIFVSVRIDSADGKDLWDLRNRSHFLRDAVLRASHREPLAPEKDGSVSKAAVTALVLKAAQAHDASAKFSVVEVLSLGAGADF